jgi:hypothetical protein
MIGTRNKYINIKKKYLLAQEKVKSELFDEQRIYGGNNDVIHDPTNGFLDGWTEIPNSGQFNCGIFINNDKPNNIMKCESWHVLTDGTIFAKELEGILEHQVFPKIHNIYFGSDKKSYIEMEKLDGDVTEFLFNVLGDMVLDELEYTEPVKELIQKLHQLKTSRTIGDTFPSGFSQFNKNYLELFDKRVEHLALDDNAFQQLKGEYNLPSWITQEHLTKMFGGFSALKDFYKMNSDLFRNVTYGQYDAYIKALTEKIENIIPMITQQILALGKILLDVGYYYVDFKYDNFGYTLENEQREHLGINWKNNKIGDKFLYLYGLDWSSGLYNCGKITEFNRYGCDGEFNKFIKLYNNTELMAINGQYSLTRGFERAIISEPFDQLRTHFSDEFIKIITTKYLPEFNFDKFTFTTLDEILDNIKSLQELQELQELPEILELSKMDELQELLGSGYHFLNKTENHAVLIKSSSGRNNCVSVTIGKNYNVFTIVVTYLDSNHKPATSNDYWPMGQISTQSLTIAKSAIDSAYQ